MVTLENTVAVSGRGKVGAGRRKDVQGAGESQLINIIYLSLH